jgi:HAD superfamily hydrolase (TIGR01509 family)
MVKAVVFDLFETLITESRTQPAGVSSLAPDLGCERRAFRGQWKALRPAVMTGRVSFRQALSDITTRLGSHAEDAILQRMCDQRIRAKGEPFAQVEHQVLMMLDYLRSRDLRLGIVSNCFAEDVAAWPQCSLASHFDCTVFSFQVGIAKPDPEIYVEATRRLRVDVSEVWFIGDGSHGELSGGAGRSSRVQSTLVSETLASLQNKPCSTASVASVDDFVGLVEQSIRPLDS